MILTRKRGYSNHHIEGLSNGQALFKSSSPSTLH